MEMINICSSSAIGINFFYNKRQKLCRPKTSFSLVIASLCMRFDSNIERRVSGSYRDCISYRNVSDISYIKLNTIYIQCGGVLSADVNTRLCLPEHSDDCSFVEFLKED